MNKAAICRFAVGLAAIMVIGVLAIASPAGAGESPPEPDQRIGLTRSGFESPAGYLRPRFRWPWPGMAVEEGEVRAEVRDMAGAGFGGAEAASYTFGIPIEGNPPETWDWGTHRWASLIDAAAQEAARNDFQIDPSVTENWSWSSPAVTGDNIDLSTHYLSFGMTTVSGASRFAGEVPAPLQMNADEAKLVAVTAARPSEISAGEAVRRAEAAVAEQSFFQGPSITLDPASTRDLTSRVRPDGRLVWEAPAGDWVVFAFWSAPTRQPHLIPWFPFPPPEGMPEILTLDYFSGASTKAALDYLDEHLVDKLEDTSVMRGSEWFDDSVEISTRHNMLLWTQDLPRRFRAARGYELAPQLPVIFQLGVYDFTAASTAEPLFDFPQADGERVRHDFMRTLTELYVNEHLEPWRRWAHRHGTGTRHQAGYGLAVDVIEAAKAVDVPETEQAGWNMYLEFLRTMSSGAHLSGSRKTSIEIGDQFRADYMLTFEELKRLADKSFSAGINQLVLYGYPYKKAPAAKWPSWQPFSSDFNLCCAVSEGWGPALPQWRQMRPMADYLARAQTVLQAGRPMADVAVYHDAHSFRAIHNGSVAGEPDAPASALDGALSGEGLSFDFVNPSSLEAASRRAGSRPLVVGAGSYRALVVDLDASHRFGQIDNRDAVTPETARMLRRLARRGVPLVFLRRLPSRGVSYRDPAGEDAAVRRALSGLERMPNVRVVEGENDLPEALRSLGVEGDLRFGEREPVLAVHRRVGERDVWFLWNSADTPARFTASFAAGARAPTRWDLWSGERTPIAEYQKKGARTEVPLELDGHESAVVVFDRPVSEHVTRSSADSVLVENGRIVARSTGASQAELSLSTGRRLAVEFPQLPSPRTLSGWKLDVADYTPSEALGVLDGIPQGIEHKQLRLTELADWRDIGVLRDTSGVGTYRTAFELTGEELADGRGAYLELGRVEGGSVQVRVNGRPATAATVPPRRIDIGDLLRTGTNTIEVELATTLKNRLDSLADQPGYTRFTMRPIRTQPYGLIGPVRIVPYADEAVTGRH